MSMYSLFFCDYLITEQLFLNFLSHAVEDQPIPTFHFYMTGEVISFGCAFFFSFFLRSHAFALAKHAGLWTVFQVVLWQDNPCPEGTSCHAIWLSDTR